MTLARVKIMNDHIIASWQAARCTAARYVVCIDTISGSSLRPAVIALFRSLTRRYSIQSSWLRSSALTLLHLFSLSLPLFHFFSPFVLRHVADSFTLACSRSVLLFFLLRSLVPSDRCYLSSSRPFLPSFLSLSLRFTGVFYSFTRVHAFSLHFFPPPLFFFLIPLAMTVVYTGTNGALALLYIYNRLEVFCILIKKI